MRMRLPARPAASGRCWELPGESSWHRTWVALLLLSLAQILAGVYLWFNPEINVVFFGFYIAYALSACLCMILRAKWGLLWFAAGSLLYCVWLSVLCWRGVLDKRWVEMCLNFSLAALECLILCLAVGHFRELGGLAPCCGMPTRNWLKHSMLKDGGLSISFGDHSDRYARGDVQHPGGGRPGALYIPPHPSHPMFAGGGATAAQQDGGSSSSDGSHSGRGGGRGGGGGGGDQLSESDMSRMSSASSSYNAAAIGKGFLAFPGGPSRSPSFYVPQAQEPPQAQDPELADPIRPSPSDHLFSCSPPRSDSFYVLPAPMVEPPSGGLPFRSDQLFPRDTLGGGGAQHAR